MDVLNTQIRLDALDAPLPANDGVARIPVRPAERRYRRVALHNGHTRAQAGAVLLALAFCTFWVALRAAAPDEIADVRERLAQAEDRATLERFDAAVAASGQPSLLRLHWLRLTTG